MKNFISTSAMALLIIFGLISCNQKESAKSEIESLSFELTGVNDTVNMEYNGLRQGHWIIKKATVLTHTVSSKDQTDTLVKKVTELVKVEEGFYKDNKKEGFWKQYYPTGKLKDSVNYKNGVVVN